VYKYTHTEIDPLRQSTVHDVRTCSRAPYYTTPATGPGRPNPCLLPLRAYTRRRRRRPFLLVINRRAQAGAAACVAKAMGRLGGGLGAAAAAATPPSFVRAAWQAVRWSVVVPALQLAVYVCAAMSLMLFLERMYMAAVVTGLWLRRRRRRHVAGDGQRVLDDDDDLEADAGRCCPMVLVQIPMFNEGQVSETAY
jgi:hypothetical protein